MNEQQEQAEKKLFDLVVQMGELILINGGEIFRAHETMLYTAKNFGLADFQAFEIANGLFASVVIGGRIHSCQVRVLPLAPVELCRVEALNTLSREIAQGRCTPEMLEQELERVKTMKASGHLMQIFASGLGSGCFCKLFQGSWGDCAVAFLAGVLLYWFLLKGISRMRLSKIMVTIINSAFSASVCLLSYRLGLGDNLDIMVIGSLFPLMPGVALTNAVRNLLENDYLAGLVRMADALITAGCIAIGVVTVLSASQMLGGM